MRAVVQRVARAAVRIGEEVVGEIGPGLVVLLAVAREDGEAEAGALAEKIAYLRIFDDDAGRLNRSILDTAGSALVVSQFTLYGDASRGRRPSFVRAAPPEAAEGLHDRFVDALRNLGVPVATGRFRTTMLVEIHNDGPVTLVLDTDRARAAAHAGVTPETP
jgi:D-tyrosyl-tRNA(Tyr) deacylase